MSDIIKDKIYRAFFSEFAPDISNESLESNVKYLLSKDFDTAIDVAYKEFTGSGPGIEQINYFNELLGKEQQSHAELGYTTETFTAELDREEEELRQSQGDAFDEEAWQTQRTDKLFDFEEEKVNFQETERDKALRSEILNKDKFTDGWQVSQNEMTSMINIETYFGDYGITTDDGTWEGDGYIKVFAPNNPNGEVDPDNFYTLEVNVDKPEAQRNWKDLKTWISKQDGLKTPMSKEDKEYYFNGATTNTKEVADMTEENFKNEWMQTLFGVDVGGNIEQQTGIRFEQTGLGEAIQVHIPNEGNFKINLQAGTFGIGGDPREAQEVIQKILDYRKSEVENPQAHAVALDFKANKFESNDIDDYNELLDVDKTAELYKNIGLTIRKGNRPAPGKYAAQLTNMIMGDTYNYYVVEKDGEVIFRGAASGDGSYNVGFAGKDPQGYVFSGDRNYNISGRKAVGTISGETVQGLNLTDFMLKYALEGNITPEQYETLNTKRRATIKKAGIESKVGAKAMSEILQFEDRSVQNTIATVDFLDVMELKENDRANEENVKAINEIYLKDYNLKIKERDEIFGGAIAEDFDLKLVNNVWEVSYKNPNVGQSIDPKKEKLLYEYAGKIGKWQYEAETLYDKYEAAFIEYKTIRDKNLEKAELLRNRGQVLDMSYDPEAKEDYAWGKSWSQSIYEIGALFGSESAKEAYNQEEQDYLKSFPQLTYKQAIEHGKKWEYAKQAFAENNAMVFTSLATAGTGTALNLSAKTVLWSQGAIFALPAGGGKRIQLWNASENVEEWKKTKEELTAAYQKGGIPEEKYKDLMLELDMAIEENDYEWYQKTASIASAMIVEGLAVRYIGGLPSVKYARQIGGKDLVARTAERVTRGNTKAFLYNMPLTTVGGMTLESLEEYVIYGGEALSNVAFLGKDFDMSNWDEVVVNAAIVAGPMNGTGAFYSTVTNQVANAPIRKYLKELTKQHKLKKAELRDEKDPARRKLLASQLGEINSSITNVNSEVELKAMGLSGKKLQQLLIAGKLEEELLTKAGIDPTMDSKKKEKLLKDYAEGLNPEKRKKFMKDYNSALETKKSILDSGKDYMTIIKDVYGEDADIMLNSLKDKNPNLKNADPKEQAIAVHNEFKRLMGNSQVAVSRTRPENEQFVDEMTYGPGGFDNAKTKDGKKRKNRDIKKENDIHRQIGALTMAKTDKAIVMTTKQNNAIIDMLKDEDLDGISYKSAKNNTELKKAIKEAYEDSLQRDIDEINSRDISKEQKKIEIDKAKEINKRNINDMFVSVASGATNAFIRGNHGAKGTYIVRSETAARKQLEAGNILPATAIAHEFSHALDFKAFDEAGLFDYNKKLHNYIKNNFKKIHDEAIRRQSNIGNYRLNNDGTPEYSSKYVEDYVVNDILKKGTINEKTGKKYTEKEARAETKEQFAKRFFDEYTRSVQEIFQMVPAGDTRYASKDDLKSITGLSQSWANVLSQDYKIKTDKDAAVYMGSFLKSFQESPGKTKAPKLAKRRIKARKKKGLTGEEDFVTKRSMTSKQKADIKNQIDKLGKVDQDGNNLREKGVGKFLYQAEVDSIIKQIKEKGYLDNLIAAKYKADKVPVNFVSDVMSELTKDIKNFNPEENDSLFGYLQGRITFRAGDVYNKIYKKTEQEKRAKDVDDRTKEGDVKVQVAAEEDSRMKEFEEKDISPAARAREKAQKEQDKVQRESDFRKELGIETGDQMYNKVLDAARQALLKAYETGTSARNIQRKLRDQANSYIFKEIKNLLGTKQYTSNLKKFRVPIMNSLFVSDLVQLERNVPDDQKIFTKFVKKLTNIEDVEAAVNQNLLPESALVTIGKGQAVNLYTKRIPTEAEFLSYFDIPSFNPVTGQRSGKRGTRKDTLARNIAGALAYDAILQVAQEPDVVQKRQEIAELNNVEILQNDLDNLARTIQRDPNVKFSEGRKDIKVTYKNRSIKIVGDKVYVDFSGAQKVLNDLWNYNNEFNDQGKINYYRNLSEKDANKYGGKFIVDVTVDAYVNRGMERVDNKTIVKFIKNKLKGRKKLKVSTIYEQFFIELAENAVKKLKVKGIKTVVVNPYVREGGIPDVHFTTTNGVSMGLEIKMDSARAVSVTWKWEGPTTNPNPTNTTAQNNLKKKILETMNDPRFIGMDFKKGVDASQRKDLMIHKNMFIHSESVTAAYLEYHYTNKAIPEYFINIGEAGAYYMLGSNPNVNAMVVRIANELGIPRLGEDTNGDITGTFELISRMNVGSKPRSTKGNTYATTIRIEPIIDSKSKTNFPTKSSFNLANKANMDAFVSKINKSLLNSTEIGMTMDMATKQSRNPKAKTKGITVLDFDDTLATTKSRIRFTRPDGTKGKLNAEEYARTYEDLLGQGYEFDFSEFTKVVKGKTAPLFNKALKLQSKFGNKDMFVLTARPEESALAIHTFLKANGLNIPLKNITGLANSTAEAKALWMAEKVGEGYNDFYFADDALQNVQAVANMLEQFDVKSKVQQAKTKFSKGMSKNFNDILERVTGIDSEKQFDNVEAKLAGRKTKYKSIIPASAQDFMGLLYNFLGKGKEGENDLAFFKKALVDPFARGVDELNSSRQAKANDLKNLFKQSPKIKKKLKKKITGTDFTYDQAVRVYLWNKAGFDIPGLSKKNIETLDGIIKNDTELQSFAETISLISKKKEGYTKPGEYWFVENINSDLLSEQSVDTGRAEVLQEWQANVDVIFSKENLNKIEAIYGSKFREALEDVIYRMKNGRNRPTGNSRIMNEYMNWVNGSVGAIMFFNMRSAILQTISATNYINWSDNNPLKAGMAFANQKQFWSDFTMLFNSDFLKQRRSGNKRGINEAELSQAVKGVGAYEQSKAVIRWLLKKGFLPTQIADSFAIASGGASFYRNRVNSYVKQGMSKADAELKAFLDFQEATEVSQQSARPDMISQQQASPLGRLILSFQNTPMQYARIMNKAARDITNRRGDYKTHMSKIIYYGVIQSIIFGAMQSALFAVIGDEDEEEYDKKKERIINGMVDSWLAGIGYGGKAIGAAKNTVREYQKQRDKGWNADQTYTLLQAIGFSPPIGSKLRKIYSSIQTEKYNREVMKERGFTLDNPTWSAIGNVVEGVTNLPLGRISNKMLNIDNVLDSNNETWQRIALLLGWNTWDLGIKDQDLLQTKEEIKRRKKKLKEQEKENKKKDKEKQSKKDSKKKRVIIQR
tara:strand:- start:234 stop:9797 length:9564 start_codon:yes stop_codon:yes gene_type:complete